MTKRIALLILCLLASGIAPCADSTDGPYVMLAESGAMTAWYAEPGKDDEFVRRTQALQVGEFVTVGAVGARPEFRVPVRAPEIPDAPDEVQLPPGTPLFLMADTHGEFEICTELLIRQRVIDESLEWRFGRGHLVVLGDVLDRGDRQLEILWLLYKLEVEARSAGGEVHLLLGNHEALLLTGDFRYLNPRYARVARALRVAHYGELWGTDSLLGRWIRTKPAVLRIGGILALHGGIAPGVVDREFTLSQMNSTIRGWLRDEPTEDAQRLALLKGPEGPLWYRGYLPEGASVDASVVEATKRLYGVERIAVGHTAVEAVTALYGGSVIAVQVYPSRDTADGRMRMQGAYVDDHGAVHRADINGDRQPISRVAAPRTRADAIADGKRALTRVPSATDR